MIFLSIVFCTCWASSCPRTHGSHPSLQNLNLLFHWRSFLPSASFRTFSSRRSSFRWSSLPRLYIEITLILLPSLTLSPLEDWLASTCCSYLHCFLCRNWSECEAYEEAFTEPFLFLWTSKLQLYYVLILWLGFWPGCWCRHSAKLLCCLRDKVKQEASKYSTVQGTLRVK